MKVALFSFHTFSQPGGVKNHILGLYEQFKKRGIETKIIAPRRHWRERYKNKDIILLGTSFPLNFSGSQADLDINFNPLAIEKTLKKERFDVLHFHNFSFPSAWQILSSPYTSQTLNILTFHANLEGSKLMKTFPILVSLLNKICQWKIDGIIGVAPLILKIFKEYNGPKTVIPNGISLEKFNPQGPGIKKFLDGKINILFLGRIEERKGLIYLLKAYQILEKKYSNLRLIVVGEGPLKKESEKFVKENKLREVHFEGRGKDNSTPLYYRTADIFVSPAIFGESFGIVLLEAMASGTPLVTFGNEGYKELLKGKIGERFMAEPKDFQGLAEKIEILIKDKKLREEVTQKQLEEVKEYSWPRVAERVLNFYQEVRILKLNK